MMKLWNTMIGISVQLMVTWIATGRADILYAENTDVTFDAWLADTKPGFTVTDRNINGRGCYCRVPTTPIFPGNSLSISPPTASFATSASFPSWFHTFSTGESSITGTTVATTTTTTERNAQTGTAHTLTTEPSLTTRTTTTNIPDIGSQADVTKGSHAGVTNAPDSSWKISSWNSFNQFSIESLGLGQLSSLGGHSSSFDMIFMIPENTVSDADTPDTTKDKTLDANTQEALPTTMDMRTSIIDVQPTSDSVCGPCNATYVIGDDWGDHTVTWSSPGWDQGINYPDGCLCTLTVKLQLMMGSVSFKFANNSNIFALENCSYDKLEVQIDEFHYTWCDYGIAEKSEVMMTFDGTPKTATFTFISDPTDGRTTEKGFQLIIEPTIFG